MIRSFIMSAILVLPLAAFADGPMITKVNHSGTNKDHPEWARAQTCDIYSDHAVVTDTYGLPNGGSVSSTREFKITLSSNFGDLVQAAAAETLNSSDNQSCGFATTSVTAGTVVLFSSGGCGQPHQIRNGGSSLALMDVVNNYCPKTFN